MGYRGRLIFPFVATLRRLDTTTTATSGGYDPDFRTTRHTYPGGVGVRTTTRKELSPVDLRCQVEIGKWGEERQVATGDAPDTSIVLVFHMKDLETAGLVDAASGDPLIRVNDRLTALKRVKDNSLVQLVRDPPGLYATEVQIGGFGLGGDRNLLMVTFGERSQGLTGSPG